jgi:predicted ATP-grasp superfamily ATP-dependent carboligase
MKERIRVAVYPCGAEIGLEINAALRYDKYITLFGINSTPSHGPYVFAHCTEPFPFPDDPDFIDALNVFIEANEIDFLIPSNDDVGLYLSENRVDIACRVLIADVDTCRVLRSKKKTYDFFEGSDFVPRTYAAEDVTDSDYPLFAKPDIGQGSEGVAVLTCADDLARLLESGMEYSIAELLVGSEYTVDCFTDAAGRLLVASMRERTRTKSGISVSSRIMEMPEEVRRIADSINDGLKLCGVWFFQVKKNAQGAYRLLEAAPRVAGTMGLSRVHGFNFIRNTINMALGHDVKAIANSGLRFAVDRALVSRYRMDGDFGRVYLDYDDVLVQDGAVNPRIIGLVYQWRNEGRKITLLSRHATDLREALRESCISEALFDEIVWIGRDERKSDHVVDRDAIFIDDSFGERLDVHERTGIPVFDVDAVEALVDWRR